MYDNEDFYIKKEDYVTYYGAYIECCSGQTELKIVVEYGQGLGTLFVDGKAKKTICK